IRLGCMSTEPFSVELIVGSVFSNFQKRFVDSLPIGAVGWKEDTVALFAEDIADGLNFSFPLVRGIVEQDWSIIDDGVGLALLNRLKSILHFRKFRWINIVSSQIFRALASLHGREAFAGKVFATVDIAVPLLQGV